jgi:type IV secretory pathway TraG/TraD family ATPase VirD4
VRVAPADAPAAKPLAGLLIYAAARELTAHEHTVATGGAQRHKLLMAMDEVESTFGSAPLMTLTSRDPS